MQKRKWKNEVLRGERFRQTLTVPKIRRFAPENNNPHGRESYQVLEYRKRKGEWVYATYTRFCSCRGCKAYLELLQSMNPARAYALTKDDGKPANFRPKALPEHVQVRRRLAMSLGKWK
jgi:hypothetical protein